MRRRHQTALCGALLAALVAVAACGKAGDPFPPEGERGQYTYPNRYPPPQSVTPNFKAPQFKEPEELEDTSLSPSPYDRTRSTIFSSE